MQKAIIIVGLIDQKPVYFRFAKNKGRFKNLEEGGMTRLMMHMFG
jgi:hypothetical protein